jgi:hypothetical protein
MANPIVSLRPMRGYLAAHLDGGVATTIKSPRAQFGQLYDGISARNKRPRPPAALVFQALLSFSKRSINTPNKCQSTYHLATGKDARTNTSKLKASRANLSGDEVDYSNGE